MTKKIGRNEICPCNSGLKYKKCCLNNRNSVNWEIFLRKFLIDNRKTFKPLEHISTKISDEEENSFYRIFGDDKVEYVNPIEYYKNYEINKRALLYRDLLQIKHPSFIGKVKDDFLIKYAKDEIEKEKFWDNFEQAKVHENYLKLFETVRKKDLEALLRGMTITPKQLMFLIFRSYSTYGYLYSRYRFENLPKNSENKKKPKIAEILEDGVIKTIGETDLTHGQIKNMIEQRKVIVSHFFDKGDVWHCLFITYNSIGGKENWKNGQSHFHYISSAFGITRENFIESMKAGQYKSTPIHIELLEYDNQIIT